MVVPSPRGELRPTRRSPQHMRGDFYRCP